MDEQKSNTNYKYEITIRHADGKDVNVLFEEERFKVEVLNTELQAMSIFLMKKAI